MRIRCQCGEMFHSGDINSYPDESIEETNWKCEGCGHEIIVMELKLE